MQSNSLNGDSQDQGYSRETTQQEKLSQPKRMTGNNPDEFTPNDPMRNDPEINPNAPQTGNNPDELNPNTPRRENTPNEINPNTPQTGNNPNEINPNIPQTGNNSGEITPNSPQTGVYTDSNRQEMELADLPENSGEKKEGYAETPSEEYVPEINGNEKYQPNYQDGENPPVVTE